MIHPVASFGGVFEDIAPTSRSARAHVAAALVLAVKIDDQNKDKFQRLVCLGRASPFASAQWKT